MIARASKLFLPTLRDAPGRRGGCQPQAARPRRLHPPGQRGPLVVHAARLARAPQGRADHPRGDGRDRLAGDASRRCSRRSSSGRRPAATDPRALPARGSRRPRLRAAADARGDVHVPRARAPELQAAAAALVPLPDQGPRRAAPARRPPPRPRVHHEGLVLVRPRRGRPRAQLRAAHERRTTGSSSAAASSLRGAGRVGDDGRQASRSTSSRRRARARTRSSPARTATSPPTSRSRARPARARVPAARSTRPRRSRRRARRRSRRSPSSSAIDAAATSKAMPVTKDDGTVVLALVRGDDRLERGEARRGARRRTSRPATEDEIRAAFGADPAARSARSASRAR